NTILQYCGLDASVIDYMIDDAPAKHGFYTPGSHLQIKSRQVLDEDQPDYAIIFAWSFLKEIASRCDTYLEHGGKFIIPLPEVAVLSLSDSKLVSVTAEAAL